MALPENKLNPLYVAYEDLQEREEEFSVFCKKVFSEDHERMASKGERLFHLVARKHAPDRVSLWERIASHFTMLGENLTVGRWGSISQTVVSASLIVFIIILTTIGKTEASIGKLTVTQGSAIIHRGSDSFTTNTNADLRVGDSVEMDGTSEAKINFFNEAETAINSDTKVEINEVLYQGDQKKDGVVALALEYGSIKNSLPNSTGTDPDKTMRPKVEIKTPKGTIEAKKSTVSVEVDKAGATKVSAKSQTITVKTKDTEVNSQPLTLTITDADEPQAPEGPKTQEQNGNKNTVTTPKPVVESKKPAAPVTKKSVFSKETAQTFVSRASFAEIKLSQIKKALDRNDMDTAIRNALDYEQRVNGLIHLINPTIIVESTPRSQRSDLKSILSSDAIYVLSSLVENTPVPNDTILTASMIIKVSDILRERNNIIYALNAAGANGSDK